MFQNIKITSLVDKVASTGNPYKQLEVQDESGAVFKVNVFNDFPDFANLRIGGVVRGQLVQKEQYTNLLSETQSRGKFGPSGGYKQKVIEETMARKEKSISGFQDNKDFSIMVSSTMRDAVSLAIAEIKDITTLNTLEKDILKWRTWLIENWNIDPKDVPPFN